MTRSHQEALEEIRAFGLAYPGAHYKSPWPDHLDLAVNDKTFAYLSVDGRPFSVSCKLPSTGLAALELPNAVPAGYGLGKYGWVAVSWGVDQEVPIDLVKRWLDESYRAQAPKRLVRALDASGHGPGA